VDIWKNGGPTIALRADMDALKIDEKLEFIYGIV